jgi:hypothetical protein
VEVKTNLAILFIYGKGAPGDFAIKPKALILRSHIGIPVGKVNSRGGNWRLIVCYRTFGSHATL